MTKNTYGTGSFVLMNVGETCPDPVEGLLTTVALDDLGGDGTTTHYALEGAIFVTGAAVQWLRDGLGIIDRRGRDRAARRSRSPTPTASCSCPRSPASAARGGTRTRGAPCSASPAAPAAPTSPGPSSRRWRSRPATCVEAMAAASGRPVAALRADGGASVMDLLLQLQADQLQVPVARPAVQETTALGAAYLAGLAEGVWESIDDIAANWVLDAEVRAGGRPPTADVRYEQWKRAVERARRLG